MKKYIIHLVALFFSIEITAQEIESSLTIQAVDGKINLEEINASQPTHVIIEGVFSDRQWKKILAALPQDRALRSLEFRNNELETLPYDLTKNYGVKKLTIRQNPFLDLELSTRTFADWKCLDDVALEVEEAEEIPEEWCSFSHINEVLCIHPDYPAELSLEDVSLPFRKYSTFLKDETAPSKRLNLEVISYLPKQNVASTQGLFYSEKIDTVACKKHYVSFSSPAPKLDQIKKVNVINNTVNQTIVDERSGTEIFIPANAFVTADGRKVVGEVAIDYREFRNPVEFMMSGIPMSNIYNSDPTSYFQSAGMFEINASINGEEVFLQPDKKVTINFESTDSEDNYPFWAYNDSTGQWEDRGITVPVKKRSPRNVMTTAYYAYNSALQQTVWKNDTTTFHNRFESSSYRNVFPSSKTYTATNFAPFRIYLNNIRRTRAKEVVFSIRSYGLNRELGNLSSIDFRLDTEEYTRAKFRRRFAPKKCDINDARLVTKDGAYILRVKDGKNILDLPVTPVKYNHKKKTAEEVNIKNSYKRYLKTLNRRATVFNKKISKKKNFLATAQPLTKKEAYDRAYAQMEEWEKQLTMEQWEMHVDSIITKELDVISGLDATSSDFTRSMSLSNFGVFNCDQIRRMEDPVIVLAKYTKDNVPTPTGELTYVINTRTKSVFSYQFASYEYTPSKFVYDGSSINTIIHFQGDKISFSSIDPDKIDINPKEKTIIALSSLPEGTTNGDLLKLIGL